MKTPDWFRNRKGTILDDLLILMLPILALFIIVSSGVVSMETLERWDIVISIGLFAGMILLLLWDRKKRIPVRVR